MVIDGWAVFSEGANLLLPMWATSGAPSSLGNLLGGAHVLNQAEKPRSEHRSEGSFRSCLFPGPCPLFQKVRGP